MSRQTLFVATLLAAGFCILPVAAEIKTTAPGPLEVSQEAKIPAQAEASSRLRCWQYGQLLFEANGISGQPSEKSARAVFQKRGNGETGKLMLINSGTSTCLFEAK